MGKDREHAAAYINLDRYRAGSALALDARLKSTFRFLTDVAMRHSAAPDELNVEGTLGRTLAAWEADRGSAGESAALTGGGAGRRPEFDP